MGKSISPARQRNAVAEGMALGLCMRVRYRFRHDKLRVDLAFERAWRDWPIAVGSRRSIPTYERAWLARSAMTWADELKRTCVFFWDHEGPDRVIYGRSGDWESNDENDVAYTVKVIDGDVPLEGWISLADMFPRTSNPNL